MLPPDPIDGKKNAPSGVKAAHQGSVGVARKVHLKIHMVPEKRLEESFEGINTRALICNPLQKPDMGTYSQQIGLLDW